MCDIKKFPGEKLPDPRFTMEAALSRLGGDRAPIAGEKREGSGKIGWGRGEEGGGREGILDSWGQWRIREGLPGRPPIAWLGPS